MSLGASFRMQQALNFLPDPHGQGSFRPTFLPTFRTGSCFLSAVCWLAAIPASCRACTLDFGAVEAISEARERISEKLAAKRAPHAGLDIKLAAGGIRDIEFLVQCLQRLQGGREAWVRHGGTLFALSRLHDKDLLSASE